ncbi:hypothetical protein [Fusibacter ferrireducens]|uniref:N-acetyltransferase domain-containing protein n=1 Tax=Fusibacter ferrireducens TaxID=2785058 RepID=A0ABR9ZW51_9FIRM|nr:hypothetical protein [Fusibacter ferrireducens]MBF4694689.1 hypothetical protein [Fusibacter ferrireducens]
MHLKILNPKEYMIYYKFYKSVYKNRPEKKDDMGSMLLAILKNRSTINKRTKLQPLLVYSDGVPVMGTILAQVDDMSTYIQMSFFEAVSEDETAFSLILEETKAVGDAWGAEFISGALNIHVNYGLGFLCSHYDQASSFGMNYNPAYYNQLFTRAGFETIDLVTYKQAMQHFELPMSNRVLKRVKSKFTVRTMDYKHFKRDIQIYTALNNDAFKHHLFYFKRSFEEDYELFRPFRILLKEENLLIVERDHQPVGFMLWYPDYNELIPEGKTLSINTVLAHKFLNKPMSTFKIVEMGVIESEQKTGAILALFDALNQITKNQYAYCESSWILKNNRDSSNFGLKWSEGEYKKYAAYTRSIHG